MVANLNAEDLRVLAIFGQHLKDLNFCETDAALNRVLNLYQIICFNIQFKQYFLYEIILAFITQCH